MVVLLLVLLGAIFGSFCNAVVWRLHEQQFPQKRRGSRKLTDTRDLSILTGRSMCTHCGHQLAARDLIPVISFVMLRGRCRYCRQPISDTPLAELALPVLFVVSYLWWPYVVSGTDGAKGWTLFGFWLVFLIGFVILALYDRKWFLLPDKVVFPLIGLAIVEIMLRATIFGGGWQEVLHAAWGVLLTAGLFFVLHTVSRGSWIGFGDVKLAVVLGLLVGGPVQALLLIFAASLLGSLAATPLLLRGKAAARTRIPFGPFLLAAAVFVVLFGDVLAVWYTHLLVI